MARVGRRVGKNHLGIKSTYICNANLRNQQQCIYFMITKKGLQIEFNIGKLLSINTLNYSNLR